MTIIKR